MSVTDTQRRTAVARARWLGFRGIPYVYGGTSTTGMDCSGLTMVAWQAGGFTLPHNSGMQAIALDAVPYDNAALRNMRLGDLVFYGGTAPVNVPHVAMFVGRSEKIRLVAQATQPGTLSEVIRMTKYEEPTFVGFVGH